MYDLLGMVAVFLMGIVFIASLQSEIPEALPKLDFYNAPKIEEHDDIIRLVNRLMSETNFDATATKAYIAEVDLMVKKLTAMRRSLEKLYAHSTQVSNVKIRFKSTISQIQQEISKMEIPAHWFHQPAGG